MMDRKDIPQRKLAALTGISKTRLGLLLHSDPTKRSPMTVDELQIILHALGTDIVAAYVRIKASRSEEHTSELQSLMRISYAVFCLKKKKLNHTPIHTTRHKTSQ